MTSIFIGWYCFLFRPYDFSELACIFSANAWLLIELCFEALMIWTRIWVVLERAPCDLNKGRIMSYIFNLKSSWLLCQRPVILEVAFVSAFPDEIYLCATQKPSPCKSNCVTERTRLLYSGSGWTSHSMPWSTTQTGMPSQISPTGQRTNTSVMASFVFYGSHLIAC